MKTIIKFLIFNLRLQHKLWLIKRSDKKIKTLQMHMFLEYERNERLCESSFEIIRKLK